MSIPYTHPIWCDPRCCVLVEDTPTLLAVEHRSTPMAFTPNADPENRVEVALSRRDEHGVCPGKGELRLVVTVHDMVTEDDPVSTTAWLSLSDARMFAAMVDHEVEHAVAVGRLSPRVTA